MRNKFDEKVKEWNETERYRATEYQLNARVWGCSKDVVYGSDKLTRALLQEGCNQI